MSFTSEFAWLKGFAKGRKLNNLLLAIHLAEKLHNGQKRKNGEPYLIHPVRVTCALASLGIDDDEILSSAILHDVIEDCNVTEKDICDYGISMHVASNVDVLSKKKGISEDRYYKLMEEYPDCILVKLADRCNNMSTMVGAFNHDKMISYCIETETYIIPLGKYGRKKYPHYSDQIFYMKYHLESICNTIKGLSYQSLV